MTVEGCNDPMACNYNSLVNQNDGSCLYYDALGVCGGDCYYAEGSCILTFSQVGCMDEEACNYYPEAIEDDGSCLVIDAIGICAETAQRTSMPMAFVTTWMTALVFTTNAGSVRVLGLQAAQIAMPATTILTRPAMTEVVITCRVLDAPMPMHATTMTPQRWMTKVVST